MTEEILTHIRELIQYEIAKAIAPTPSGASYAEFQADLAFNILLDLVRDMKGERDKP